MTDKAISRTLMPLASLLALLLPACASGGGSASSHARVRRPGVGPGLGTIRGVVRDVGTGHPISFATVYAHSPALTRESSATTAGDGAYRLSDLDPGRYRITARYSDFTARYEDIAVHAGEETTVDIRIRASELPASRGGAATDSALPERSTEAPPTTHARTGIIKGTVIDGASGTVLAGAVVAATAPHMRDAQFAMADEQGGFRLLGLRPGSYTLSVYYHLIERGNIEVRKANIVVRAGETVVVDLKLDAKPYD